MLRLTLPKVEYFNEVSEEFIECDELVVELEHSLVSLSKWESFWEKPFMANEEKTNEQILSYIDMMILSPEDVPTISNRLSDEHISKIQAYIESKQTATWFTDNSSTGKTSSEIITAELLYYWMMSQGIPMECQYWHLNRLITLLRVFGQKNKPAKKMSAKDIAQQNRELNAARRAKYNSPG